MILRRLSAPSIQYHPPQKKPLMLCVMRQGLCFTGNYRLLCLGRSPVLFLLLVFLDIRRQKILRDQRMTICRDHQYGQIIDQELC